MKLLLFFVALVAVAATTSVELDNEWKTFVSVHGKRYKNSEEETQRRALWLSARRNINKHNKETASGVHKYYLAINYLADKTPDELLQLVRATPPSGKIVRLEHFGEDRQTLPTTIDLRNDSCMPPIKNQGMCGSCWAFSATTPVEYKNCKKVLASKLLSEQQLTDCVYPRDGCNGGWYTTAWNYIKGNMTGQTSSAIYPYVSGSTGVYSGKCKYNATSAVANVTRIPAAYIANNETAIKSALNMQGPLSVALFVNGTKFFYYSSGVYSDTAACANTTRGQVNHAVVLVGYGTLNGVNHWIVRNSWGTGWGIRGYMLVKRGINLCNIEYWALYPIV